MCIHLNFCYTDMIEVKNCIFYRMEDYVQIIISGSTCYIFCHKNIFCNRIVNMDEGIKRTVLLN